MWKNIAQLARRRWRRTAVTLVPLVFALLHLSGILPLPMLERLDNIFYDIRLRATMPRTLDERIVIVDIDEKSLERVGHWPWGRDKMATLATELFERQQVAVVGFDVLFAEADGSSGLRNLQQLAQGALSDQPAFRTQLERLAPSLDFDSLFAESLKGRPAVLGYYLTSDKEGRTKGILPPPALSSERLRGLPLKTYSWGGYGSNIDIIAGAVPVAGFFNSVTDEDGVVRALPLLAEYQGRYYESLALAMFRTALGLPEIHPGFANPAPDGTYDTLHSVALVQDGRSLALPVDDRLATLIPFRGPGDVGGGSFRYLSASDVLEGKLPPNELKDRMILVGSTAPGLLDLRVTPVGRAYPGVETHANVLSAFLDGKNIVRPDYAVGFDALQLVCAGLLLAFALPALSAAWAVLLSVGLVSGLTVLNLWLYLSHGLALPLASAVVMVLLAFTLNMVYGYFVESRSKRELAALFGTYVPPELVDEMVKEPDNYSMQASNQELTVMFCDMRGFTAMSEQMEPLQLQALLNDVFSRLTHIIRSHRGTIDKYMGDCVMAFWGAPVATPDHARLAVQAALDMARAIKEVNLLHRERGLPEIGIGIGLNTGNMCVGDMGSDIRRSYTVIGDSVNLASRLEGLSKKYAVLTVVSETTRIQAVHFIWQELDRVRVKGKAESVAIFTPVAQLDATMAGRSHELSLWQNFLVAYRAQDWTICNELIADLMQIQPSSGLYSMYGSRVQGRLMRPFDPKWDGANNFDTK
ncbi:CHASE2 domain-containing protein [Acidovorax sp. Leaf78]|uniref:CHASE2 domain-containing protein n=1 Tax=unclassified Acidovorax TaxID=2684926 RepID=UPI0007014018|nr:adenylate/guanylate cyclase domain-containing protein [Acidovorax sp. Leaf78]KQO16840.1 guanylate cyclase [Acidovorax sp. Leaf78]RYH67919.1 MAG: adenylate/guanylate cyclase domain-containing protein [Alcaligenaceae bacterium]